MDVPQYYPHGGTLLEWRMYKMIHPNLSFAEVKKNIKESLEKDYEKLIKRMIAYDSGECLSSYPTSPPDKQKKSTYDSPLSYD